MSQDVKRYAFAVDFNGDEFEVAPREVADGRWVRWQDYEAAIAGRAPQKHEQAPDAITWQPAPQICPQDGKAYRFRLIQGDAPQHFWVSWIVDGWVDVPWEAEPILWQELLSDAPGVEIADAACSKCC